MNSERLIRAFSDTHDESLKHLSAIELANKIHKILNEMPRFLQNPYTVAIFWKTGLFTEIKNVPQSAVDFALNVNDRYYHNY